MLTFSALTSSQPMSSSLQVWDPEGDLTLVFSITEPCQDVEVDGNHERTGLFSFGGSERNTEGVSMDFFSFGGNERMDEDVSR